MGLFSKVASFLKREAKDIGEAADDLKDTLDAELTKREQELQMSPSEKIQAIQQDAQATDDRIDSIVERAAAAPPPPAGGPVVEPAAAAPPPEETPGVEPESTDAGQQPTDPSLPNITHIVLPDGRVKSGDDVEPPPPPPPDVS